MNNYATYERLRDQRVDQLAQEWNQLKEAHALRLHHIIHEAWSTVAFHDEIDDYEDQRARLKQACLDDVETFRVLYLN